MSLNHTKLPAQVKTELAQNKVEKEELPPQLLEAFKQGLPTAESTEYSGKAVVALATDPNVLNKTGKVFTTAGLGKEYGFKDIDGREIELIDQNQKCKMDPNGLPINNYVERIALVVCVAYPSSTVLNAFVMWLLKTIESLKVTRYIARFFRKNDGAFFVDELEDPVKRERINEELRQQIEVG